MRVDGPGDVGQFGDLDHGYAGGGQLLRALTGGEQRWLTPGVDDPGQAGVDDVLDAGNGAGGTGAARNQRTVDGRVPEPGIRAQLAQRHFLGVVVFFLLAGETSGQDLAVLAHDHRTD